MAVQTLLLESLEQLRTVDFEKFQWYLTEGVLQSFKSIPRSHLEHASRPETVTRIVERYGEDKAVEITIQILREIGNNNEAEKLMKAHSGVLMASSSTTPSSVTAPAAPATMLAKDKSAIVAPTISNSTIGEINITFRKHS